MPARRARALDHDLAVSLIACELTTRERAAVDEMKTMLALADDADLLRCALYHYARWLEPNTDPALFVPRRGHRRADK